MDANGHKTLAQKTSDDIIEYIIRNNLKPGDKLPKERELTQILCVSRSAVREALCILSTMHIVRLVQGSGIYLESPKNAIMLSSYQVYMSLDYANIDEMYEVWLCLEADAAALAAKRITPDGVRVLQNCLEEMKNVVFDMNAFFEYDVKFHHIISACSNNRLLSMNLRSIDEIVTAYRKHNHQYLDIRKAAFQSHCDIFDAIRFHDPQLARQTMEDHLAEVKRAVDYYKLYSGDLEQSK